MRSIEVNDFVRILPEPKDSVNAIARVVKVSSDGVWVSNLNMPFCGTLAHVFYTLDNVYRVS